VQDVSAELGPSWSQPKSGFAPEAALDLQDTALEAALAALPEEDLPGEKTTITGPSFVLPSEPAAPAPPPPPPAGPAAASVPPLAKMPSGGVPISVESSWDEETPPGKGPAPEVLLQDQAELSFRPTISPALAVPEAKEDPQARLETMALPELRDAPGPRRSRLWVVLLPATLVLSAVAVLLALKLRSGDGYPVVVSTDPTGAAVFVDGERRAGATPLTLGNLERSRAYDLLVILDGYKPWQRKLTLDGTPASRTINAQLEALGAGGSPAALDVKVAEPGAEVYLDGERQGAAPIVLDKITSGVSHTLVVKKEGFEDEVVSVSPLTVGERRTLSISLRPSRGVVEPRELKRPVPKAPRPEKKDGAKKDGAKHEPAKAAKKEPKGSVAGPKRTPSLQSPREGKIGEHLPGKE